MAKFYLYSCNRYVYRYLSSRMIACLEVLSMEYGAPALAHIERPFLCITTRQLNRESRLAGGLIDQNTQDFPLALRFNIPPKIAKNIPVYLVKALKKRAKCELTTLDRYKPNSQNHICAFVVGELPFSLVEGFLFDTSEDLVNFERPMPDLWYPESLYDTIDHAYFSEDLPISSEAIHLALKETVTGNPEVEEAISAVKMRERIRAALYGAIIKTNWRSRHYTFNMDSILQEHFGLSDRALETVIPQYSSIKSEQYTEPIPLLRFGQKNAGAPEQSLDEQLYAFLLDQISKTSAYAEKGEDFWQSVLNAIADREDLPKHALLCDVCDSLRASLRNEPNCEPVDILSKRIMETDSSILAAFLFVARNLNNLRQLSDDLKGNKADPVTSRRAFLLWFSLNAMYDVPGKGAQKDNAALWQHVESYVSLLICNDMLYTLAADKRVVIGQDRKLLGISLGRNLVVMKSEMIAFFLERLQHQPEEVISYCESLLPQENKTRLKMDELYIAKRQIQKNEVLSFEDFSNLFLKRCLPTSPDKIRSMIEENLSGWAAAYRAYWDDYEL